MSIVRMAIYAVLLVLAVAVIVRSLTARLNKKAGFLIAAVCFAIIIVADSFAVIPTGYSGVRTRFGQISAESVSNGFSFKIPFVESIKQINNKQQDIKIEGQIWSESAARTAVYAENITVSYTISPEKSAWVCAHVSNYERGLIQSDLVASAFKSASKKFEDTDVTNRSMIEPATKEALQNALNSKYEEGVVEVNNVTISNIDFDESYNQAIADKQNAQLAYEKQQIENQTLVEKAQAEADAKVIAAQGEAEANKTKQSTLTDEIIQNQWIEKWNGELPSSLVGSNTQDIMVGVN